MDPNSCQRKRRRKPRAAAQSPTTIESLVDDVLGDILVRLPSSATLGRAALACRRWLRLATSRDFLRRFRALHPSPPLLGCFVVSFLRQLPAFHRAADLSDRDLAAAVRGSDFSLTSFSVDRYWYLKDCLHGLFLFFRDRRDGGDGLAVFDPVSRRRISVPCPTHEVGFAYQGVDCLLPPCATDASSSSSSSFRFRVVSLECSERHRVRVHVYSSRTRKWRAHPWAPRSIVPPPPYRYGFPEFLYPPMHAAGRIYWKLKDESDANVLLSLDTESMELSYIALPPLRDSFHRPIESYVIGDMEDGTCCLVSVPTTPGDHALQVWLRNEEHGSWELKWELAWTELMFMGFIGHNEPTGCQVAAVVAGVVVLVFIPRGENGGHFYVALRIMNKNADDAGGSTRVITGLHKEAHFFGCPLLFAYPYLMAWPRNDLLQ